MPAWDALWPMVATGTSSGDRRPRLDPVPPTHPPARAVAAGKLGVHAPGSAATVSVFGSFVTRIALPFVAIEVLRAGPIEVAVLRSLELAAALLVGFVAGAWVDRLRRRPVMIGPTSGARCCSARSRWQPSAGGRRSPRSLLDVLLAAILTTFFDVADKAYLPTVVPRSDLVRANGALAATTSAVESWASAPRACWSQVLTAPIAILIDAVTFPVSALLRAGSGSPSRRRRSRTASRSAPRSARACGSSPAT